MALCVIVPSVPVIVKVVVPSGVFERDSLELDPEPHPEMPKPTANIAPASQIRLTLFHFLRIVKSTAHRMPIGRNSSAPLGASVSIARKIDAVAAVGVSAWWLGKKRQLVYKGRLEQLKLTVPLYPPVPVRVTVVFTV